MRFTWFYNNFVGKNFGALKLFVLVTIHNKSVYIEFYDCCCLSLLLLLLFGCLSLWWLFAAKHFIRSVLFCVNSPERRSPKYDRRKFHGTNYNIKFTFALLYFSLTQDFDDVDAVDLYDVFLDQHIKNSFQFKKNTRLLDSI